jgi:hypothetical protein
VPSSAGSSILKTADTAHQTIHLVARTKATKTLNTKTPKHVKLTIKNHNAAMLKALKNVKNKSLQALQLFKIERTMHTNICIDHT